MAISKLTEYGRFSNGFGKHRNEDEEEEQAFLFENNHQRQNSKSFDKMDKFHTFRERSQGTLPYKICLGFSTIVILILIYLVAHPSQQSLTPERISWEPMKGAPQPSSNSTVHKALVLASFTEQDIEWMHEIPADYTTYRYKLDDGLNPFARYTVPRNKGREGMAYLTFIIDFYYNLPDFIVFMHGHNRAWHQLAPTPWKLRALNFTAVTEERYINMRCGHNPGCTPETLNGKNYPAPADTPIDAQIMPRFWNLMFPPGTPWGDEIGPYPSAIGAPCCAQFAVSREAVLRRPIEFWKGMRSPMTRDINENKIQLKDPTMTGHRMGTYYEKLWHVAFGKSVMNCPNEDYCRKVFFQNMIDCERDTGRFKISKGWRDIKCNTTLPEYEGRNQSPPPRGGQ